MDNLLCLPNVYLSIEFCFSFSVTFIQRRRHFLPPHATAPPATIASLLKWTPIHACCNFCIYTQTVAPNAAGWCPEIETKGSLPKGSNDECWWNNLYVCLFPLVLLFWNGIICNNMRWYGLKTQKKIKSWNIYLSRFVLDIYTNRLLMVVFAFYHHPNRWSYKVCTHETK